MGRKGSAGFTLLELTVALVITSLVILAVAASLASITGAWERGQGRSEARASRRALEERLGAELLSLDLGPFGAGTGFAGGRDGFSLTAAGAHGTRRLSLALSGQEVILREQDALSPASEQTKIPLAGSVARLECSYFDPARGWRDEWGNGQTGPPALLRLTVHPEAQSGEQPDPWEITLPVYAGRNYSADGSLSDG